MTTSKETQVLLALAIGVVLIVAIVAAVLLFVPLKHFELNREASVTVQGEVRTLDLVMDVEIADVTIVFQSQQDKELYITLEIDGRTAWTDEEPDVTFEVEKEEIGPSLTVHITLDMETATSINYEDSSLVVLVDPSLATSMDVSVGVGDLSLRTMTGVELGECSLRSDVGSAKAELRSGTVLSGDMDLRCRVGSVQLTTDELSLEGDVGMSVTSDVGSVKLDIEQGREMGGNLTLDCSTDVGSIDLQMIIGDGVGAVISSAAEVGSINVDETGFSGGDTLLTSDNYPDASNILLSLETNVGSVNIDAERGG